MVELSGPGALSITSSLVLQAQGEDEPVAWITRAAPFFPPDLRASQVDLAALPVVRVKAPLEALRAADLLLRSGAFGLIVVDLGRRPEFPLAAQTRLAGAAQKHATVLLMLTTKDPGEASMGSLVSLHGHCSIGPAQAGEHAVELRAQKDKRRGPGWTHRQVLRGPPGLR